MQGGSLPESVNCGEDFDMSPESSPSQTNPSTIIYHYCPDSAFVGILNSRCLWLSSGACLNDKQDGRSLNHIIDEETRKLAQAVPSSRLQLKWRVGSFGIVPYFEFPLPVGGVRYHALLK